jgi:hypothetical protein
MEIYPLLTGRASCSDVDSANLRQVGKTVEIGRVI